MLQNFGDDSDYGNCIPIAQDYEYLGSRASRRERRAERRQKVKQKIANVRAKAKKFHETKGKKILLSMLPGGRAILAARKLKERRAARKAEQSQPEQEQVQESQVAQATTGAAAKVADTAVVDERKPAFSDARSSVLPDNESENEPGEPGEPGEPEEKSGLPLPLIIGAVAIGAFFLMRKK